MPRFAVFAGSVYAARDWARENRVSNDDWFFVVDATSLRGLSSGSCIPVLGHGFWGRMDAVTLNTAAVDRLGRGPTELRLHASLDTPLPGSQRCRWCEGEILPVTMAGVTAWVHRGVDAARWDRQSCMPGKRAIPAPEEVDWDAQG